jgi:hypothetical protein
MDSQLEVELKKIVRVGGDVGKGKLGVETCLRMHYLIMLLKRFVGD